MTNISLFDKSLDTRFRLIYLYVLSCHDYYLKTKGDGLL